MFFFVLNPLDFVIFVPTGSTNISNSKFNIKDFGGFSSSQIRVKIVKVNPKKKIVKVKTRELMSVPH